MELGDVLGVPRHRIDVTTEAAAPDSGVAQSTFMYDKARTTGFTHTLTVQGDTMRYTQSTMLDIYGTDNYDHKDLNTLTRV